MPPAEVIRAATLVAPAPLGQDDDIGSIEAGKLANLVVLARDPLADIANVRSLELTVKRGREYPPLRLSSREDRDDARSPHRPCPGGRRRGRACAGGR